jgi:hypothetical protein
VIPLDPPGVGRPLTRIDDEMAAEAKAIVAERDSLATAVEENRARRDDLIVRMKAAGNGPDVIARVLAMSKARVLGVLKERA